MNNTWGIGLLLGLILLRAPELKAAMSADEIMKRNEDARKVNEVQSDATLTSTDKAGQAKVKQFTWWKKLGSDQVHFNTLTRFHLPAEIRGEGILFLEHENNENEVLMYLPNFKKIRRVESQQQSSSFMGSEFSYSDIATPHLDDYKYKLIREENCPEEQGAALKCAVIESTPVSDSVRERTGYSKQLGWVRQDNFMMAQGEYYDLEGNLLKKYQSTETKLVDPLKKKWLSHRLKIENVKNGRSTLLQFVEVKVNQGIQESVFTQRNLARE